METEDRTKTSLLKDMKTVYQITGKLHGDRGQNQDLTVKGYEDSLSDHRETTWRQRTEPRPHCERI